MIAVGVAFAVAFLVVIPEGNLLFLLFSFAIFRLKIACQAPRTLQSPQNPTTTHLSRSFPFGIFLDPNAYHRNRGQICTEATAKGIVTEVQTQPQ